MPADAANCYVWPDHWDRNVCAEVAKQKLEDGIKRNEPVKTLSYIMAALRDHYRSILCRSCGTRLQCDPNHVIPDTCEKCRASNALIYSSKILRPGIGRRDVATITKAIESWFKAGHDINPNIPEVPPDLYIVNRWPSHWPTEAIVELLEQYRGVGIRRVAFFEQVMERRYPAR